MLSRDTRVHLAVVALAFAGLIAVQLVAGHLGVEVPTLPVVVLFYGLVFGGAHLYLAVRGEGGLVPPDARWRWVATLAALLALGVAVAVLDGTRAVAGVELRTLAWALLGVLLVAYLVVEARDGYRSVAES